MVRVVISWEIFLVGLVFEEHLEAGYLAFLRYILVYIILLCIVSYVIL